MGGRAEGHAATAHAAGAARERVLALIGDAGAGKSRALHALGCTAAGSADGPACVRVPVPTLSSQDLLRWCLHALGELPGTDVADLERRIAALAAAGRELLLLVEDADRLPLATAEWLGALLRRVPGGLRIAAGFYERAPFEPVLAALDPRARRIPLRVGAAPEEVHREVRAWAGLPSPEPERPVSSEPACAQAAAPPAPRADRGERTDRRSRRAPAVRPPGPSRLRRAARVAATAAASTALAALLLALLHGSGAPAPQPPALPPVASAPPAPAPEAGPDASSSVPLASEAAREEPVGSSEVVVVVPLPGDPPPQQAPASPGPAHAGAGDGPAATPPSAPARPASPERGASRHADAGPAIGGEASAPRSAPPPAAASRGGRAAPRLPASAPSEARADASEPGLVRVVVNASPQARIRADGRDFGLTPVADLRLAPGAHHFAATMADGRVVEREVELAGDVVLLFFP